MSDYRPFTYFIGWTHLNKFYYGVRYSPFARPDDLWVKYFTSSKYVKKFRKEHGEPDIIEVRRVFDCAEKALLWEQTVLRRMKVVKRDDFLNKNDCHAPPYFEGGKTHPRYGKKWTNWQKREQSELLKGKTKGVPKNEEHRKAISEAIKRYWDANPKRKKEQSQKYKGNKFGKLHKGWVPNDETKRRMSESAKKRGSRSSL